jgi:hypothetical protein
MKQKNLTQKRKDLRLIESLGGSLGLSKRLGYSVQRINNWKKRGIPACEKLKHRDVLLID